MNETKQNTTDDTKANVVKRIRDNSTKAYDQSRECVARRLHFLDFVRPCENILFFGVDSLETVRMTARHREALGHTGKVVVLSGTPAAVTRTCYRVAAIRSIKEYLEKYDASDTMLVFNSTMNKTVAETSVKSVNVLIGRLFSNRFGRIYIDEHISWSETLQYNRSLSNEIVQLIGTNPLYSKSFYYYRLNEDFHYRAKEGMLIHFCALCAGLKSIEDTSFSNGYGKDFFQADDSRIAQMSLREGWEVIHLERYIHPRVAGIYQELAGSRLDVPTSYQLLISR